MILKTIGIKLWDWNYRIKTRVGGALTVYVAWNLSNLYDCPLLFRIIYRPKKGKDFTPLLTLTIYKYRIGVQGRWAGQRGEVYVVAV